MRTIRSRDLLIAVPMALARGSVVVMSAAVMNNPELDGSTQD